MSLKFSDIMKNFYNDETLGIKNEDAPANATGTPVAGTGDDSSTVVVKKKKKNLYDGRTKEARKFMEENGNRFVRKRESKLAKKVQENTENFGVESSCRGQCRHSKERLSKTNRTRLKMKDGKMKIGLIHCICYDTST